MHALRLISALLDGGYSARMPARLERGQELVAGASSSYNAFTRGDSLFLISATPNVQKQKTLADVEKGVWQLLDELKTTPPSAEELSAYAPRSSPAWSMTATPSAAKPPPSVS